MKTAGLIIILFLLPLSAFSMPGAASFSPREILAAYQNAYPDKIGPVKQVNGDWTVEVRGKTFFWAGGRLLPQGDQGNWSRYDPYPFYHYPKGIPLVPAYSEIEKREIYARTADRDIHPPCRHPGFFNTLWRVYDKSSSWDRVKTIYFLGLKTEIHRELLEDLATIEEEILEKAKTDTILSRYIQQIGRLEGYNWRRIAGTSSLSFHSYGAAIDIIPYSYGAKHVYWRWSRSFYTEWFSIPQSIRFSPPEALIHIFEKYGFIWGGKWLYFDNIHFEYRPEILILNGFTVSSP